jgi:hypothetical protein
MPENVIFLREPDKVRHHRFQQPKVKVVRSPEEASLYTFPGNRLKIRKLVEDTFKRLFLCQQFNS